MSGAGIGVSLRQGARISLPVVLGYVPVGFAFGILAAQAGMSALGAGLMSWLVYAGSGQLIAAGMLYAGAGPASIVMTTFVVNLRHLLMSAAMVPYLRSWSKPLQAWFCFEMTDETFALHLGRFASTGVDRGEALCANLFSHLAWTAGGVAGALFGDVIGDVSRYGLDYALPGMFIALLVPHIRVPRRLLAVVLGGGLSVALALWGAGQWNVILATVGAASLAALVPPGRERSVPAGTCKEQGGC